MPFPDIPSGFGVPLVDLATDLLPDDTMDALDARYGSFFSNFLTVPTADPTGVSDARAAIQAKLNEAYGDGGGTVALPAGTFKLASTLVIPKFCRLVGASRSGTVLLAASGFSANSLVKLGDDSGGLGDANIAFYSRVESLTVDCADIVDVGIHSPLGQEMSGARDVVVTRFTDIGVLINGDSRLQTYSRMEVYGSQDGWNYGFHIEDVAGPITVEDVTINSNTDNAANYGTAGVWCKLTDVKLSHIHGERCDDTIVFDANATGVVMNADATTGVSGAAVRITTNATGHISLFDVDSVNDELSSRNYSYQTVYLLDGSGGYGGRAVFTMDPNGRSQIRAATNFIGPHASPPYPHSDRNGSYTIDCSLGNAHEIALNGNLTLSFSNKNLDGQIITLEIRQASAGGYTITWPGEMRFTDNTAPTLSTTAGLIDTFTFMVRGSRIRELSRSIGQGG